MITVVAPWFFALLLPAIGFLYWAYRMQGNPQRIVFSSLYLLDKLRRTPQAKRKLVLPLRFFVELCIFIALLAALAGVSLPIKSPTAVIILDNSESMGHQIRSNATLFERGLEHIESWTSAFASSATWSPPRFWGVLTAPRPHLLSEAPMSRGELLQALQPLRPVASSGNLQEAYALAHSIEEKEQLLIISDQELLVEKEENSLPVESFLPQSTIENISKDHLQNIAIETVEFLPAEAVVNITLRSHSRETQPLEIELFSLKQGGSALDKEILRRGKTTIDPGARKIFSFQNIKPPELALVTITPEADTLAADNFFYLAPRVSTKSINVFSPLPLSKMQLVSFSGFSYTSEENRKESPMFSISHLENRKNILAQSGLHVLPRLSVLLRDKKPEPIQAGSIIQGNTSHPLLDYIDLYATQFREVTPLSLPSWAEPLIEVEAGVIAYFGFRNGAPQVVAGFELFPLPGKESPMQPIFFLNCLKWLSSYSTSTKAPVSDYSNDQAQLTLYSASASEPIAITHTDEAEQRGVIFRNDTLLGTHNFYLPQESAFPLETIRLSNNSCATNNSRTESNHLPRFWVWTLLLLLCLDLLLLFFTSRYTSRS